MPIIVKATFTFKIHASIIQEIIIIGLTSNLSPFVKLLKSKKVQILNIKVIYNQRNIQYNIYYMSAKHNCYALGIRISSTDPQPTVCAHILLPLLSSTVTLKLLNKP